MTRGKRKRQHQPRRHSTRRRQESPARQRQLETALEEANELLARGEYGEALDLLEDLRLGYPEAGELHRLVGYARLAIDDYWGAAEAWEQAATLTDDPELWLNFAGLCLRLRLNATGLDALRRAVSLDPDSLKEQELAGVLADLESEVRDAADRIGVTAQRAQRGLRVMNDGERALQLHDFVSSIRASRRAAGLLPDYPPPLNNLSTALFHAGQPKQAIETAERVLDKHPDNIHALSNLTRFLTWTGRSAEAQGHWQRLRAISPPNESLRFTIAQAAAVMNDDERVCELLEPLVVDGNDEQPPPFEAQLFLAIAVANLGRASEATAHLRALGIRTPRVTALIAALESGRLGMGWSGRYPYHSPADLMPDTALLEFQDLAFLNTAEQPERKRRAITQFMDRFPQLVLVMEKIIWEDGLVQPSISVLAAIGTPEAHAALRRFGLSQAGTDDERLQAMSYLLQAGELADGRTVRLWLRGEWRDVSMSIEFGGQDPGNDYPPEVPGLLVQAEEYLASMEYAKAEQLLRRVIVLAPEAKEAYNNLAVARLKQGDAAEATELLQAALRIDPAYVYARSTLAIQQLREHNVAAAKDIMAPLATGPGLTGAEEAHYRNVLARIALEEDDFKAARAHLHAALWAVPHDDSSIRLLSALDEYDEQASWAALEMDMQRDRWNRRRWLLQNALTTSTPTVVEALSVHTKGSLTAMARLIPLGRGWSTLNKADLVRKIAHTLCDQVAIRSLVRCLRGEELAALSTVLSHGGSMGWDEFAALHGNDLEEYAYWEHAHPQTIMGMLRAQGLLAEATVDGKLLVTIPLEIRSILEGCLPDTLAGGET